MYTHSCCNACVYCMIWYVHAVWNDLSSTVTVTPSLFHTHIPLSTSSCWIKPDPTSVAIWTFVGPMIFMVLVSNIHGIIMLNFLTIIMYKTFKCKEWYSWASKRYTTRAICMLMLSCNNIILQMNTVILIMTVVSMVRGRIHGGAEQDVKTRELVKWVELILCALSLQYHPPPPSSFYNYNNILFVKLGVTLYTICTTKIFWSSCYIMPKCLLLKLRSMLS